MRKDLFSQIWERLRRPFKAWPEHLRRGRRGERLAEQWLRRERRWKPVARNWRAGRGELDLIMRAPDDLLVFVEVRGRAAHARVSGHQSITAHKRKILRRTINAYLRRLRGPLPAWRFDVVEVVWHRGAPPELRLFENVRL